MSGLLITCDLLDGINWFQTCPSSWKAKAWTDLTNKLGRIYSKEMPKAAARGITFENQIYAQMEKIVAEKTTAEEYVAHIKASDYFKACLLNCAGGTVQTKARKTVTVDNVQYCVYGKLDVKKPERIIDIKTTGNFKGNDAYLKSKTQHVLYTYMTDIPQFEYDIQEFDGEDGQVIIGRHVIKYGYSGTKAAHEEQIVEWIRKAIAFLHSDDQLWDLYYNKYNLYK
jgi:hypothetical protein